MFNVNIFSIQEPESSLITFTGSDSISASLSRSTNLPQQRSLIREKENGKRRGVNYYSREAFILIISVNKDNCYSGKMVVEF